MSHLDPYRRTHAQVRSWKNNGVAVWRTPCLTAANEGGNARLTGMKYGSPIHSAVQCKPSGIGNAPFDQRCHLGCGFWVAGHGTEAYIYAR